MWILIDVSIPANINIIEKEKEKVLKYQDLWIESQKLWNIRLKVFQLFWGSLGAYTTKLSSYLTEIPGSHRIGELLKRYYTTWISPHTADGFEYLRGSGGASISDFIPV